MIFIIEYYGSTVEETLIKVKEACEQHPNIVLMQKTSIKLEGVRLLGTTLWSKVIPNQYLLITSIWTFQKANHSIPIIFYSRFLLKE